MSRLSRLGLYLLALGLTGAVGNSASAAFSLTISPVSGPAFPAFTTPLTTGTGPFAGGDLFPDGVGVATDLLLPIFNITNNPGTATFNINTIQLLYSNNPNPITFDLTITENAQTYPAGGAGQPLYGYTAFTVSGGANSTIDFSTTTFDGTGPNTVNFSSIPLTPIPTTYFGDTIFNSGASSPFPTTTSLTFRVTLDPFENITFTNLGGTAPSVTSITTTPAPPAALIGLAAVPMLGLFRRWNRK